MLYPELLDLQTLNCSQTYPNFKMEKSYIFSIGFIDTFSYEARDNI